MVLTLVMLIIPLLTVIALDMVGLYKDDNKYRDLALFITVVIFAVTTVTILILI